MSKKKVLITGIGVITANGHTAQQHYEHAIKGVNGIEKTSCLEDFDYMSSYAGEVKLDQPLRWEAKFKKLSEIACKEMLEDANMTSEDIASLEERGILCAASANVGSLRLEPQLRVKHDIHVDHCDYEHEQLKKHDMSVLDFNSSDGFLYIRDMLGVQGATMAVNAACASGTLAIGHGAAMIQTGRSDVAVVAAVDVFSDLSFAGFHALANLNSEPCKPFDKNRNGINIGEAAVFILLEEKTHALNRNAKIYGEVSGFACLNEGYHVTAPNPTGEGAITCMSAVYAKRNQKSLKSVYVNTHGTGTVPNDQMEIKALEAFAQKNEIEQVYFSSTKSMIGHCLGASGTIEFACSTMGLKYGKMPISIRVDEPIDYDQSRLTLIDASDKSCEYTAFISNSLAFAGNVASVMVEKYECE